MDANQDWFLVAWICIYGGWETAKKGVISQLRATPWIVIWRKDQPWKGVTSKVSVSEIPFVVGNALLRRPDFRA